MCKISIIVSENLYITERPVNGVEIISARKGSACAKGEYLFFINGNDFPSDDILKEILKSACEKNKNILICSEHLLFKKTFFQERKDEFGQDISEKDGGIQERVNDFKAICCCFGKVLRWYLESRASIVDLKIRKLAIRYIKELKKTALSCYEQLDVDEKQSAMKAKEVYDAYCEKFYTSKLYKISIIIPAYNVEKYLPECLDSILGQSIKDYEVLIIDDGSTDNTKDIAKSYQKKYEDSIWVYEQNNLGPSGARNRGLEEASGEYILYIDSDDYISSGTLEKLITVIEKHDFDVLLFACKKVIMLGDKIIGREHWGYEQTDLCGKPGIQIMTELLPDAKLYDVVWLQFVRKHLIDENRIRFYPGIIHEDHLYTFTVLLNSSKCGYMSEELYNYRIRANSIMTTDGRDMERFEGWVVTLEELIRLYDKIDIRKKFPDCDEVIRDYIWYCERFAMDMKQKLVEYKKTEKYQECCRKLEWSVKVFNGPREYRKLLKQKMSLKLGVVKNKVETNIWKLLKTIKRKCGKNES